MALTDYPTWPYRANWRTKVSETFEWKTRILTSQTAVEQRAALRINPRRLVEFEILVHKNERSQFDRRIMNTGRERYYLPMYQDKLISRQPLAATGNFIYTERRPDYVDFNPGRVVVLQGTDAVAVAYRIAGITDQGIAIEGTFGRAWDVNVSAYPAMRARLVELPKLQRHTDNLFIGSVMFRIEADNARPLELLSTSDAGPMIMDGLISNSYHQETGRGGYFHTNSGTSEGQSMMIYACLRAYERLRGSVELDETLAAAYYRSLAVTMLDALGDGSPTGPMLRQPIPTNPNVITMLHWLFAARGDIPYRGIIYDVISQKSGNTLAIEANQRGSTVYTVWRIYPATSQLLYNSPYSPAYHVNPDGTLGNLDTSVLIADEPGPNSWYTQGNRTLVVLPPGADPSVSNWKIVYGYTDTTGLIPFKSAQEAWPSWTLIPSGYVACAPDTFRWFEQAMTYAMLYDDRTGKSVEWDHLRAAMRRSAVRGQSITDLRTVIEPMVGFDAIPAKGAPDGMYCYSDNSYAYPPSNGQLNRNWRGYDFWSRRPNGNIYGIIPKSNYTPAELRQPPKQAQIGRGFTDSWRVKTTYQEEDFYLYVAIALPRKANLNDQEGAYVYLSATRSYDEKQRWYAEITGRPEYDPSNQGIIKYWIPRSAFRTRTYTDRGVVWGTTPFPAGQQFENFGISIEYRDAAVVELEMIRIVGGESQAWIDSNQALAVQGSKMPFFPGALPFATNADIVRQRFVGWNGSPFHGYQLADFWYFLRADAEYVHPNLTVDDLPIPDTVTGKLIFPISPNNPSGRPKPKHALLMEQQLMFLGQAQDKFYADSQSAANGCPRGPYAHTFVLNTPARQSLGNPRPHTWVYVNDDPNTRWIGYQTRLVESLGYLIYLTKDDPEFEQCRMIATNQMTDWLTAYRVLWPNLDGKVYDGKVIYGSPTQYPDPAISAPYADYEEPHGVALVLRGCIWLKIARPDLAVLCDTIIKQSWTYMEMLWRTEGEMAYTWSPDPAAKQWYGFWHAEIIECLCLMLERPTMVPPEISLALVRKRLVETKTFLVDWGVRESNAVKIDYMSDSYRGYSVFTQPPDESDPLDFQYDRQYYDLDNETSDPYVFDAQGKGATIQQHKFTLQGKAEKNALLDMLYTLRGQTKPFWLPTFMDDLHIVAPVILNQTSIVVSNTDLLTTVGFFETRRDFAIHLKDGTRLYRHITGLAAVTATTTRVLFDDPIRLAFGPDQVRRTSFMLLSRLSQDAVDFVHEADATHGAFTVTLSFRSAPDDRQALPAFYQGDFQ